MSFSRILPFAAVAFAIAVHSQEEAKPGPKDGAGPQVAEPTQELPFSTEADAGLGEFGSNDPVERADLPERGIIALPVVQETHFSNGPHWEQYNFPFKAKRWGRYAVRLTYELKTSTLGVQLKFGGERLKKALTNTSGGTKRTYLGELYIPAAGDHFVSLYTPQNVGYVQFYPKSLDFIPVGEGDDIKQNVDGTVALLAKDATTWSETMRFEPKPEKNCLGYWTDPKDFAEWEFTVEKPGKFSVTVHQGCGGGGGSEVALFLHEQQVKFTVKDTGGFQKWAEVSAGELTIEKPGTYRLAVKPQSKSGKAIMDIQKVVLVPVS